MAKVLRKPAVAGQFYPSGEKELRKMIALFPDGNAKKEDCFGVILPHAGYVYSGSVAAKTISGINIKETLVLLGTNHTGRGPDFSIMPAGAWQTPLGNVEIDQEIADLFLKGSKYLQSDSLAHEEEHSLEVQLPILQFYKKNFKIVPISIKHQGLALLKDLAGELAGIIRSNKLQKSLFFVASSDMTHYQPQEIAQKNDSLAIEAIIDLDENKLTKLVNELEISMCGLAPVSVLITLANLLGAKCAKLVKYQTSGQVNGDLNSVVGYAGITIY